jgi:hypothetical protein
MTTTVTVKCSTCQASYQAPREREGARFKCKSCGTTLTVPRSEPAAPELPVVMPSAPPPPAPERPVVMPSQTPPRERPVVMPAAAEKSEAPRARAPGRPDRPPRAPAPAPEPRKSKLNLVVIAIVGVAILGIGGYFAWPDEKPDGPQRPEQPLAGTPLKQDARPFDAAKRVAELTTELGTSSAGQLWALAKKLDAEARSWREKNAPAEAVERLEHEKQVALENLVKLDPNHAEARALREEVKYSGELDPFSDAPYLSDSDRDLVRRNRLAVTTLAGESGGWVTKRIYESQVRPLVERFSAAQAAAESQAASPFGIKAKALETDTLAYLSTTMGGTTAFRAFVHKPYVIFVEENPGWSPQAEAKSLFSPLRAILEAFLKEFGGLGLKPLEEPVPVIYFMSEERYGKYNEKIGNTGMRVLAHYEPPSGRLVLNRGVNHEVIIHEGTHQIFDKYTDNKLPHPRQSFWFQEGIAEWFGGSNRLQAKDGSWTYETGVLLDGRLDEWRHLEKSLFTLGDLLQQTYGKRNEYILQGPAGQAKIGLVYAQGWFLIYFLNHFNVDPTGMVRIGDKGKYAQGWSEYLKAELGGKTGKKVFMECLKLDDAALEKMNKEYVEYYEFVMRKRNLGQIQDKKLVAWDKYVNKKGVKTGEKPDDLLIAPPRNRPESGQDTKPK